jgi:phosphopantothenoylcysteine decarboxylase/phosphopantothenate--cysteine ligase
MASITIRQLDDDLKQRLRLRRCETAARWRTRQGPSCASGAPRERGRAPRGRARRRCGGAGAAGPIPAAGTRRVLLIIGGGIAAYKSLDLIRRLKERGLAVRCILTRAAQQFVTPLAAGALSAERVFTDLFDLPATRVRCRSHQAGARG